MNNQKGYTAFELVITLFILIVFLVVASIFGVVGLTAYRSLSSCDFNLVTCIKDNK